MNQRRCLLLATIRADHGTWTTSRAWDLYRTQRLAPGRRTARTDLAYLARTGRLTTVTGNPRAYTLPGGTR
ncbi:hypothetical protein [Streptomyces qinglanensis]|uniref:Uncharacterized protein n=1 Tax=Streptomyces qinglanensis TaxID=943816 RepID=A0A1H9U4V2_9ACTN|nr:hypothetical protein [Streptomyces qinglanensis]SES04399.1 hypothetical protein SAMN05421870_107329 [Streptomyces qinglanensis]